METILNNFVNALNNAMQSYITYLYVHELCQTFVLLIIVIPIMIFAYRTLTQLFQDLK